MRTMASPRRAAGLQRRRQEEPQMPDTLTTNSPVIAAYRAATPGSAANALRAAEMFPSGITHDSRYIEPYGLYIARAQGPRKWDVDGRCYVDYFGGHGALLLGHCPPQVTAAVHAPLDRGTPSRPSPRADRCQWWQIADQLGFSARAAPGHRRARRAVDL